MQQPIGASFAISDLASAFDDLIVRGPLSVAFQPIVDLERGEIEGYEVLGRCSPIEGPLAQLASNPMALLDAAHACGRLLALDRRWRGLAMQTIAEHDDGRTTFFLNVDPRVVEDPSFSPGFTRTLVAERGLAPSRFVLELTEVGGVPIEIEDVLRHYASQGFRVAIDDLGAGSQSLVSLVRLSPHVVKLDRELVRGIDGDPSRRNLVRALAEFSARTGAVLVAEAIETAGELRAVREAGAHLGQGFVLGRPAPLPMPLSPEAHALVTSTARNTRRSLAARAATVDEVTPKLLRLVEGLSSASDLATALRHVTQHTAELLGVERVSVRLLDESRERLLVAARTGPALHSEVTEFKLGEGLLGWVVANGKALCVADAEHDPRFSPKPGQQGQVGAFLGVPLLDANGCIGVLSTTDLHEGYTEADRTRLELIAGVIGPHLQVARLRRLALTDEIRVERRANNTDAAFESGPNQA